MDIFSFLPGALTKWKMKTTEEEAPLVRSPRSVARGITANSIQNRYLDMLEPGPKALRRIEGPRFHLLK